MRYLVVKSSNGEVVFESDDASKAEKEFERLNSSGQDDYHMEEVAE